MKCPNPQCTVKGEMTVKSARGIYLCTDCDAQVPMTASACAPSEIDALIAALPGTLAAALKHFVDETKHPVMRLHRLCDAVEVLTRFVTLAMWMDLHAAGGIVPDSMLDLFSRVDKPSFGIWAGMLDALAELCAARGDLVAPELARYARAELYPALGGTGETEEEKIIPLRNMLAHSGNITRGFAQDMLGKHEPAVEKLIKAAGFMSGYRLGLVRGNELAVLRGPNPVPVSEPFISGVPEWAKACEGRVVLVCGERTFVMWPFFDFKEAERSTTKNKQKRKAAAPSPWLYLRQEEKSVLYSALCGEMPLSETTSALEAFKNVFALAPKPASKLPEPGDVFHADFEAEFKQDADALIGRKIELEKIKAAIKDRQSGILWIGGPGGTGKSFLMAKVAVNLDQKPGKNDKDAEKKKATNTERLVVAWRFRAGDSRCDATRFFQFTIRKVAPWLKEHGVLEEVKPPDEDPRKLDEQLGSLLQLAAKLETPLTPKQKELGIQIRAPRILFILDGMDEIQRYDRNFASLPFRRHARNVTWLCAGRPEGQLAALYKTTVTNDASPDAEARACLAFFPDPKEIRMSNADVRAMLLHGADAHKYKLLRQDNIDPPDGKVVTNAFVDAVGKKADGLPLYVRFVIEDINRGDKSFLDNENLPNGLAEYYDDLIQRMKVSDEAELTTPLVMAITCAEGPLSEEALRELLVNPWNILFDDAESRTLLSETLNRVQSMIKRAPLPEGGEGYVLYHDSFKQHLLESETVNNARKRAKENFAKAANAWRTYRAEGDARKYLLRYGLLHVLAQKRWDDVYSLLTELEYLEARVQGGQVFDLAIEFGLAVKVMPENRILPLLEEALRRDIHFIAQHAQDHPKALFQCMWNSCWWYDCPEAEEHYKVPEGGWKTKSALEREGTKLSSLMEQWRNAKEMHVPWVRSLRPPDVRLGTGQKMVFCGHKSAVKSVAISYDGKYMASGSGGGELEGRHRDYSVHVWDAVSGAELACLTGHTYSVTSIAISQDNAHVVSGSGDKTIRIWDAKSGVELARLRGHENTVYSVVISSDDKLIVTGSADRTVRIWNIRSGDELTCMHGHADNVTCVAISSDGKIIVSGSMDQTVRVWDAHSGIQLACLCGHSDNVTCVAISSDGKVIVSGSTDKTVRVWDTNSGNEMACLSGQTGNVTCVAISPDGKLLASGILHKTVHVWDVRSGSELASLRGHEESVTCAVISRDGVSIVSGSKDKTVRVWHSNCEVELPSLRGHESKITGMAISYDVTRIVSVSIDKTVCVWDAVNGTALAAVPLYHADVHTWGISPDGTRICSGSIAHALRVWSTANGEEIACLCGHKSQIRRVAFSRDGKYIISVCFDRTVRVWNIDNKVELTCLRGHEDLVTSVDTSLDGRYIVSGSEDRTVRMWNASQGEELACFRGHKSRVVAVAISREGTRIVSASDDHTVRVWDARSEIELACFQENMEAVAISRDGTCVVSRSWNKTMRVWDVYSGKCIHIISGDGDIQAIADGVRWFAISSPHHLEIRDALTGKAIAWFASKLKNIFTLLPGERWVGYSHSCVSLLQIEGVKLIKG